MDKELELKLKAILFRNGVIQKEADEVFNIFNKALESQQQSKEEGWISVKDRFPEKSGNVIAYNGAEVFPIWYWDEYANKVGVWDYGTGNELVKDSSIIKWMPLPDNPQ